MRRTLALIALLAIYSASAHARPASKGLYAEAGFGGTRFMSKAHNDAAIGLSMGIRMGLDVFSFLSVGVRLGASSHEATVPPPPEGEYFQIYEGAGDARIGVRIKAFELFADGSVGVAYISTNILEQVGILAPGERLSNVLSGGGGVEYQLQNRHYALGLAVQYSIMPQFDSLSTMTGRLYLRYTY